MILNLHTILLENALVSEYNNMQHRDWVHSYHTDLQNEMSSSLYSANDLEHPIQHPVRVPYQHIL